MAASVRLTTTLKQARSGYRRATSSDRGATTQTDNRPNAKLVFTTNGQHRPSEHHAITIMPQPRHAASRVVTRSLALKNGAVIRRAVRGMLCPDVSAVAGA
jgi:hypothetical protein